LTSTADAQNRALWHRNKGHHSVFIAQVDAAKFVPYRLRIQFSEGPIELFGWKHPTTNTLLFPMQEIGSQFYLDFRMVQRSEWLTLLSIPPELIICSDL
jgi:hypothetical protein